MKSSSTILIHNVEVNSNIENNIFVIFGLFHQKYLSFLAVHTYTKVA